jgi:anthranilate synthase component 2
LKNLIEEYARTKSILGVCLGHQAIGEVFGGKLINLDKVYHGVATPVKILKEDVLFTNIPREFGAGRYHSWLVDKASLPEELEITCEDDEGAIMGLRHKTLDVKGFQFHPESILTEYGIMMIENWLNH